MSDQPDPVPVGAGVRFDYVRVTADAETCEIHDWPHDANMCGSFVALIQSRPRTSVHPLVCEGCAARLKSCAEEHHP